MVGMTPTKYSGDKEIETTEDDSNWYNYGNKKWANAKTADGSYWVWIPRFAYMINTCFASNETQCLSSHQKASAGQIDIKFIDGTERKTFDGDNIEFVYSIFYSSRGQKRYYIPEAFTNAGIELSGFWVSKFQASGSVNNLSFKPNVTSLRNINISEMFKSGYNVKDDIKFGWDQELKPDTHMTKNSEWAAISYLAQSNIGAEKEIYLNNSKKYTTGRSGGTSKSPAVNNCENKFNSHNGVKASTTHNITGVYDMNSIASEYVPKYLGGYEFRFVKWI